MRKVEQERKNAYPKARKVSSPRGGGKTEAPERGLKKGKKCVDRMGGRPRKTIQGRGASSQEKNRKFAAKEGSKRPLCKCSVTGMVTMGKVSARRKEGFCIVKKRGDQNEGFSEAKKKKNGCCNRTKKSVRKKGRAGSIDR